MVPEEQRAIGARIAQARRMRGLTQSQLADHLGVTTRSIQNYESGAIIPYKHLRSIERLANQLPGFLLRGESEAELAKTVSDLRRAIAQHHELLEVHVRMLKEQTELLRAQREASRARRGTREA